MPISVTGSLLAEGDAAMPDMVVIHGIIVKKILELIDRGFDTKTAPDGSPWAPRKREQPWPLMVKSGDLKAGYTVSIDQGSIWITSAATAGGKVGGFDYGAAHQYGTARMVARKMVPDNAETFPAAWLAEIDAEIETALRGQT